MRVKKDKLYLIKKQNDKYNAVFNNRNVAKDIESRYFDCYVEDESGGETYIINGVTYHHKVEKTDTYYNWVSQQDSQEAAIFDKELNLYFMPKDNSVIDTLTPVTSLFVTDRNIISDFISVSKYNSSVQLYRIESGELENVLNVDIDFSHQATNGEPYLQGVTNGVFVQTPLLSYVEEHPEEFNIHDLEDLLSLPFTITFYYNLIGE